MLNKEYREQVERDLIKANQQYTNTFKRAIRSMEGLQYTRKLSVRTIQKVEQYIIRIANRPKNIDTKISQIKMGYRKFLDAEKRIQEMEQSQRKNASLAGTGAAGALGGAGIAALAPTAAMAVAMTFGTASTGTAIATLSGAAATNAALAWLGGGALAAGGLGVAGGQTLLAMAGPVGWAISGVSLVASLAAINMSNKEAAKKTEASVRAIKKEMERIQEIDVQVKAWNAETKTLSNLISRQLMKVNLFKKRDYDAFTEEEINEIMSLVNSAEVLSKKLSDKIKGDQS